MQLKNLSLLLCKAVAVSVVCNCIQNPCTANNVMNPHSDAKQTAGTPPSEYVYAERCQSAVEVPPMLPLMSSTARHVLSTTSQRTSADELADS